jgi:large subunit ribosomal protein L9
MKVVLMSDVPNTGKRGSVVEVSKGYGVNYLIPRGLAKIATDEAIAKAKAATKHKKEKIAETGSFLDHLARKISKKKFQIIANASKGGTLYGSLSSRDVSSELAKLWGADERNVDVMVDLAQPIKETGKYPIDVVLKGGGVEKKVEIILSVVLE